MKTEFFDSAVQQGFYGKDHGGLKGKKDNVRKYWEDISIKTAIRQPIQHLLHHKPHLRILDLGSGSGEGYSLLTHIPPANKTMVQRDFVLDKTMISSYLGVDISAQMIEQGRRNFASEDNIHFIEADLNGDLDFLKGEPFDVYFSSYSSPSHVGKEELRCLVEQVFEASNDHFVIALDLFGRYSAEWPGYWDNNPDVMHPYNMLWLYCDDKEKELNSPDYFVHFWSADEISTILHTTAKQFNRTVELKIVDRSLLVGRHIDTGYYNHRPQLLRQEVNKLFDRDYRGNIDLLTADISFLAPFREKYPKEYNRIAYYAHQWNTVVDFLSALFSNNAPERQRLVEQSSPELQEELHVLSWLTANASRFPVVDFWASVLGPQVACVLRNLELDLPNGLGCGHGMFCVAEVK